VLICSAVLFWLAATTCGDIKSMHSNYFTINKRATCYK
jgi:hypothetical protein